MLITNRYVDEDQPFFELAEEYLSDIVSVNDQLNAWEYSPAATEKWLLKYATEVTKPLKEFKAKVEAAREKLSTRF